MHLKILACDLDGTLTDSHHLSPAMWASLKEAKEAGFTIFFVTGRILENFLSDGPFDELADAIVAENGAVVYFPVTQSIVLPFGKLAPAFLHRVESLLLPLEEGRAILATHVPHDEPILEVIREAGGGATIEYNRGSVMVLPPGAAKGTGLQHALRELGYSPRNLVCFGDAENDVSLFEAAELAVAVANASNSLQRMADVVTTQRNGKGVEEVVRSLIKGQVPKRRVRPERRLRLGEKSAGPPFLIDPFVLLERNLGVLGDSASGKSWLSGLLAEQMLALGYQICIIDPEGDYRNLRAVGHTLILGGTQSRLPPVVDVVTLAEYSDVSLILDLSAYSLEQGRSYVTELLHGLVSLRRKRGRPHWFLFDEIQNFCGKDDECDLSSLIRAAMGDGGFALVSYRPSQMSETLLEGVGAWLLTRLEDPSEIDTLQRFAGEGDFSETLQELPNLPAGRARMLARREEGTWENIGPEMVEFQAAPRKVPHVRHVHKYLRVPLAEERRFYFRDAEGRAIAQASSLWHFTEVIGAQPLDCVQRHLVHGDFESWIRGVLGDSTLADRVRRLRKRQPGPETARRILAKIARKRYEELESL